METNVDYSGADILNKSGVETQYMCAELCALTDGGLFWTYAVEDKKCYVKGSASGRTNREGHIYISRTTSRFFLYICYNP